MATKKQELGQYGEELVRRQANCPRCKRVKTLKRLPTNFKCADLICDFCGYLAQVKTTRSPLLDIVPDNVLGAAWRPQKERMDSGIYFPLFLVLIAPTGEYCCYYLSADLQSPDMFVARKPLSAAARRSGWQGFMYVIKDNKNAFVRLFQSPTIQSKPQQTAFKTVSTMTHGS